MLVQDARGRTRQADCRTKFPSVLGSLVQRVNRQRPQLMTGEYYQSSPL